MKKLICLAVIMLLNTPAAEASDYFSIGLDNTAAKVSVASNGKVKFEWGGLEFVYIHEGEGKIISGWSVGGRKQSFKFLNADESYIQGGIFKDFNDFVKIGPTKWDVRLWLQAIFGIPGTRFNRTVEKYENGQLIGYYRVNLITDKDLPISGIKKPAVLYPEILISIERDFGKINFEPMFGLKIMKFRYIETEKNQLIYMDDGSVFAPTYGFRIGYKF
jgi:hypothetical protein